MPSLSELAAKQAELRKLQAECGKEAVMTELAAFFTKYPALTIGWAQYTPYFNDGEPCTFSLHGVQVWPEGMKSEDDSLYDMPELGSLEWSKKYHEDWTWITDDLVSDARSLYDLLNENESLLEVVFGDHKEVIANKDGVQVEDHDHD